MPERIPDGAIHEWFGLSYANYLVVPRSVLQSMPLDWQERFTECLTEMYKSFGHLDYPSYDVRCLRREREVIWPRIECEDCAGEGERELPDGLVVCDGCYGEGHLDTLGEYRYETAEEVGVHADPIPPYDRGRTRISPRVLTPSS